MWVNSLKTLDPYKAVGKLKPCPFCGGAAAIVNVTRHIANNLIVVKCDMCGASTKTFSESRLENAIAAWNKRTQEVK